MRIILFLTAIVAFVPTQLAAEDFAFEAAGNLLPNSGRGVVDPTVYAPGITFPIDHSLSYANSQVWDDRGCQRAAGQLEGACELPLSVERQFLRGTFAADAILPVRTRASGPGYSRRQG